MVTACTIVARNYLPHARVLTASFLAHHPDGEFFVLIIDDESRELDATQEAFRCVRLSDLGLDQEEIGRMAGIYDVTELATAVKPPMLRWLLAGGRDHIIYLDPDIKVFDSLEGVAQLARAHDIVLTPHTMVPIPRDKRRVDGLHILGSGVYNLGFIALGTGASDFIEWWWSNTRREALMDHQRMMFTDQRWIDFVPSFFGHHILKHPGYNAAYWNLHSRDLTWTGTDYQVNGEPLYFFHFSGFDHRRPHLLSKHQGDSPRILLSERPALARLCREYLHDLEAAGIRDKPKLGYGWETLSNGLKLDRRSRRAYWSALVAHERDDDPAPPNPFSPASAERFVAWLNEPLPTGPREISRYLFALYQDRPDLQLAFPDISGEDATRFRAWVHADGIAQEKVPPALLPPIASPPGHPRFVPPDQLTAGVNVAGYLSAELGIGEAARLMVQTLDHAGIPSSTITYNETSSRKQHAFSERGGGSAPYDVNLICVNADRTPHFARDMGRGLFQGRRTAGYWFWEIERFPEVMHPGFAYVEEVWAATRFVTKAIASANQRPVFTVPVPVPVPPIDQKATRAGFALPDGPFMFLFMFDFFSILERKNPVGLVNAFTRAFKPNEGPILVLKTINGHKRLNDLEKLRYAIGDRSDVLLRDEYFTAPQKNALLGLCDCYTSLHRSEGLGLTMAEAMGLGKPVIATGYSGNLDFMSKDNSYLVDYTMTEVPSGSDPYPAGTPWAEPSVESAAALMRQVVEDRSGAEARASRGRRDVLGRHSVAACAPILQERIEGLRASRRSTVAVSDHSPIAPSHLNAPPPPPLEATLAAARQLLTPSAGLPTTAKLRGLRLRMQSALIRMLRPYWWQQRALHELLIDSVRSVNERRGADAEARHAEVLRQLELFRDGLQTRIEAAVANQLGATGRRVDDVDQRQQSAAAELRSRLDGEVHALRTAGQHTVDGLHALSGSVEAFHGSASTHLARLTEHLGGVAAETRTLVQRLYAAPYVSDPAALYTKDAAGREIMGYDAGSGTPAAVYRGFEDVFRGDESFIRDRFRCYLPLLRDRGSVLDVGSGRGEMLDLLREAQIPAHGVDLDAGMVERCQAKGLDVTHGDAIEYLETLPDGSLGAIFASQFIEHLPYETLNAFLRLAHAKLAAGGLLIAETVNPHSIEAFRTFWTDLTHQAPIFPEVALTLCRLHGFSRAQVRFGRPTGNLEEERRSSGDYAVIASR